MVSCKIPGDIEKDSLAVRIFLKDGHQIALAQSYAKNMGLYGEYIKVARNLYEK